MKPSTILSVASFSLASKFILSVMFFALAAGLGFAAEKPRPLLDRFGDPLPDGALHRFGTVRFRNHELFDLALTSDGKQLFVGDGCSPIAVFDAITGRKIREIGKQSVGANSLTGFALSPHGKQVVCCGSDVFVWDRTTGQEIRQLHCGLCKEVAFTPDGTKLAAAVKETTRGTITGIAIVEATTGKHLSQWTILSQEQIKKSSLDGIAFSPDGKFIATMFSELREEKPFVHRAVSSHVWLLDAATGKRVRTFGSAAVPAVAFAFQPGTGLLATLGKDGILCFWDVATGKETRRISMTKAEEGAQFGALQFSDDGRRCAVRTDRPQSLLVLDTKDGRIIRRIEREVSRYRVAIAFSGDGRTLAAAGGYEESCVHVWDVESGEERLADAGHCTAPNDLSLSSDGRTLLSRDARCQEIHWNRQTEKGTIRKAAIQESGDFIWSADFGQKTLRGPRWRVVCKNQRPWILEVWSLDRTKLIRKLDIHSRYVPTIALSPDGTQMAMSVTKENAALSTVMLWNPEQEEKPQIFPGAPDHCWDLSFSLSGKRLIARSGFYRGNAVHQGAVWIWDTSSIRLVRNRITDGMPSHLRLTADDRVLLAGINGKEAAIRAWDLETGQELANMVDPSTQPQYNPFLNFNRQTRPAITGLALSADERLLAAVSSWEDGSSLSIWETGTGKLVRTFAPISLRNEVKAMLFSHDCRSLFVANSDTTILEWDISGRWANGRRQPAGEDLNTDRLNHLWRMLAETPDKAYPAVWELLDHPAQSIPFLKKKAPPVKLVQEKQINHLLAQFDSPSFAEREEASRQLVKLGEPFLPKLRLALSDRQSPEARRRLERVLEAFARGPSAEQLRLLRALAVLEWSDDAAAGEHLRQLAEGAPLASLTKAAKGAWQRRAKR